ncbi:MAG: gingipain R, partial [Bacteroidetes bacterium]|nr:gingipain R [Bacteroidota bacterium]
MKKLILISVVLFSFLNITGNNWINIKSSEPVPAKVNLISSNIETSVLQFSFDGFFTDEVQTPRGIALNINLENTSPLLIAGAPDLLKLTSSVIIPDLAKMELKVISSSFRDFENMEIAPSKGNLTRDIDPASVPYVYGKQYEQDKFFPEKLAELRNPYIIRDYRGQTIVVYPFQYNPVKKVLRVYYDIIIEVKKLNDDGINPLIRDRAPEKISTEFKNIYQRHFLNTSSSRYTPVDDHGNMLIICYADFMSAMQPLIEWKTQTGIPTEIVNVATIGNSAAIKTYIVNYYNNNGLTFVLLVGDGAQVPTSYSNGHSDNNYSYIVGNDHYPDLFVGRFSAENVGQVETQVERTVTYEQDPYRDIDWFTIGTGIASDQGPGDDGEYDYQHIRNINTDLLGFTYTYCHELFDGSQGGNDASGNPTPSMVAEAVNDGTTIINYCGHGSTTSWGSSGFSNPAVNNLTNSGMLPFIWSVACKNGNFVGTTCFAEAWLRAEYNGEPSGAIATLMSTINQSWNPPMCGQDEMVDILVESYQNNIKRTFGGISMNGCMQMNDEYGSGGDQMTDTWTCFGDPSLMVRTAIPQDMTVSYYTTVFIGATQLTLNANAEGGVVALTLDGAIISTAFIENGTATLQFDELTAPGIITITITGFNFLPHIGTIEIVPSNCPYIVYESNQVIDTAGNNNNMIDFGESIQLSLAFKNIGGEPGNDVVVDISTNDDYIILNDSTENYGNIASGQTVSVEGGFAFDVSDSIPDQHVIIIDITISDSEDSTWYCTCQLIANAPVLSIGNMIIDDGTYGNNNGRLDPGETADIKIKNYNLGHCFAENTIATLTTASQYITMQNTTDTLGTLGFFMPIYAVFTV